MPLVSRRSLISSAAISLPAFALAGCSSTSAASGSSASASADLQTIKIGVVPTLVLGFLTLGDQQGFFAEQGLKLQINQIDSGPNVITGLVAGQYDLGYTGYAPPLVALASGQDLRLVEHLDDVGPEGTNAGLLVRKDSPITRWKDIGAAKLGTNAPRSLGVLWIQAAISADGGDVSKLQLVPLPFNQIGDNVASSKLDIGFALEPYLTQSLKNSELRNLGDPATKGFTEGTPSGGIITSAQTFKNKQDLIAKFKAGYTKSLTYGNNHLDDVRASGAKLSGLSADDAKLISLEKAVPRESKTADFDSLVDALQKFGWVKNSIDIKGFLGQ